MAGIYIHIPFCRSKCHYCNFYSLASVKYREAFSEALRKEIRLRRDYLEGQPVRSVYFGGGTPSLLDPDEIESLFAALQQYHSIAEDAEITVEANPDDLNEEWVRGIAAGPVNRLSIGVQSFFDEDLLYLNRVHTAYQAQKAIELVRKQGINNITIDLIYGIPGLTEARWGKNLDIFFNSDIPHLSAYALTVEEKTALHVLIKKNKIAAPDENDIIGHYRLLIERTHEKGFVNYEISNFAREGFFSNHNSLYWAGGHYLGLGPSAHSYNGFSRRWNKPGLKAYFAMEEYYGESFEEEVLDTDQRFNEYVMTSLRTIWGCNLGWIRKEYGEAYLDHLMSQARAYLDEGKLIMKNNILYLSPDGKLFADGISAALFR